ncbi:MAG: 50S ribosomal protein L29 [Magnetococcales bacterium]|nr:50S ribosomal protein L29 [Magnetococcales bacterium]MBF0114128.1 50S ribosomal protein L29 [Magnetococcales bacterium]
MKSAEIREMTVEAANVRLQELYQETFNLRFRNATSQLENTARIRQVRREIARIKTEIGSRSQQQVGA